LTNCTWAHRIVAVAPQRRNQLEVWQLART
jgi:hypothetical protein